MNNALQFLIYNTPDESVSVNAVVKDETIWLTQKAMAELFDVQTPAINKHLSNIFDEGELEPSSTISKMEIVQDEGGRNWTVLEGKGKVSHKMGLNKAHKEYDEFNKVQKIISYFDKKLLDEN